MLKRVTCFLLLFIILIAHPGCNSKVQSESIKEENVYSDNGDFKVLYSLIRQPTTQRSVTAKMIIDKVKADGIVSEMMNELNKVFKLPQDLIIQFRYSDSINAWYDPNQKNIHYSTRFIELFIDKFASQYTEQQLIEKVNNVIIFFLFHELGHALMDIYDMTRRGPEEDMADYFSVFLLSTWNDRVKQMALDGAEMFYLLDKGSLNTPLRSLATWDSHSLSIQRFFKICCLVYGSDPSKYDYLRTRRLVQDPEGCAYEYAKVINGWQRDLKYFMHSQAQQE